MRRAKIVCTLGPATSSPQRIGELMDAGMNMARLNMSHGDKASHIELFESVREQARIRNQPVAILCDLQGPKIRVGKFSTGAVQLKPGRSFTITTDTTVIGNSERVSTGYDKLPHDVKVGDPILLDDGILALTVTGIEDNEVTTVVATGGLLKNNKGINLPGVNISAPTPTSKDRRDLGLAVRLGADYIALSFVRTPEDVVLAKKLATVGDHPIPIIAKIEKPEAIEKLKEIIEVADGIMVARGDLGVEMGPEKVPLIQKRMIRLANAHGKLVITATQMLESMIQNPRPTRAEASDVANAVLDGTDALMLSGETAAGNYPIEVVTTMDRIICEVESSPDFRGIIDVPSVDLPVSANAIAHAAVIAARALKLQVIAVVTSSGGIARLISEYRPEARVFAFTDNQETYRRLASYWGISPILLHPAATTDELLRNIEVVLKERNIVSNNEQIIVTAGVPIGSGATTNMLKLQTIS